MKRLIFVLALSAIGCSQPEAPFDLVVRVVDVDGAPVVGAPITVGKQPLGSTDGSGVLRRMLNLQEGMTLPLSVTAPPAYKPIEPVPVVMRRISGLNGATLPTEQELQLEPRETTHVVLVRTGVAGLPILAFGEQRAVTDASGAAMFAYHGEPGEEVPVRIDTSQHKELMPQNPTSSFVLSARADAHLIQERFGEVKPAAPRHVVRAHGPRRL
jgi:hypothetical protein